MDHQELTKILNKMNDVTNHLDCIRPLIENFVKGINCQDKFESSQPFFGGGCIRDLYVDKVPKDYDIFFTNHLFTDYILMHIFTNTTHKHELLAYSADDIEYYLSKSPLGNLNLRIVNEVKGYEFMIQFIAYDIFSSREEFRNRVDFTINSNTYWYKDLVINDPVAIDSSKLIPLANTRWVVPATARARYFVDKGYFISYDDFINLAKIEYNFLLLNCFLNVNNDIPKTLNFDNICMKADLSLWNS